ncbi:ArpU family phage packaging/lysis transcriptional regulator [Peribacillus butanolivorans]|uniref:ArpU family phage packaging/lysis transcriptional regulator n=1 Tax=Peribacillus butanolivorans TaxID=421767 RepID=UPI0037CB8572
MGTQLSFFPDVDEKKVRYIVVKELKLFRALKIQQQNKKELNEKGITIDIFPKLYDNDQEKEMKILHMQRALNNIDNIEQQIIEMKYLANERQNDINIYLDLGLQKTKYYEKKKQAIYMIAHCLNIL